MPEIGRTLGERVGPAEDVQRGEGLKKGEVRARQKDLRTVLNLRFGSALPADAINLYARTTDPNQLEQWFKMALTAANVEEFSQAARAILETK